MARKVKILYLITQAEAGGAQRYIFDLATNLPEDKFETAVALGGGGLLKEKLDGAGIRTIAVETLGRDIKIFNDLISFFKIFQIIKKEKPDIILLDIVMDEMDGIEVLKRIRADEETSDLKVILLTNLVVKEKIDEGKKFGALDYIIKSQVEPSNLVKRVRKFLKN